jgi:hypothetical protein
MAPRRPSGFAGLALAAAALACALTWSDARAASPSAEPGATDPQVLTPPPLPDFTSQLDAAVMQFRSVYVRQGSPRIVIYWNRELTDRLAAWQSERRAVELTTRSNGSRSTAQQVMKFEQARGHDPERHALQEGWQWEFQDGFLYPLLRGGVRVVDRAAIQRLTVLTPSGSAGVEAPDRQAIEMRSLQRHAQLWAEVLMTPAEESPTGVELRVVVKDVMTGAIVAHTTSGALGEGGQPSRYVATSRGFERRPGSPPSPRELGARLAMSMMDALAMQWSH